MKKYVRCTTCTFQCGESRRRFDQRLRRWVSFYVCRRQPTEQHVPLDYGCGEWKMDPARVCCAPVKPHEPVKYTLPKFTEGKLVFEERDHEYPPSKCILPKDHEGQHEDFEGNTKARDEA